MACAENLALAANLEVFFGDLKSVGRLLHYAEAFFGDGGAFVVGEQDAVALIGTTTDATTELVKLRKAKTLGVFDDHQRGVWHIDSDLDHRC